MDVSQNIALTRLRCPFNQISSLNVTQNPALFELACGENQLNCLNVKNGNNTILFSFNARINPNLTCIEVDDVAWSTANWLFSIDSIASFSANCPDPCIVGVNDVEQLSNIIFYPNPTKGNISIDLGEIITDLRAILTNGLGQVISTQKFESTDFINIDLDAPAGIYFLKLETNGGIITKKIVKE